MDIQQQKQFKILVIGDSCNDIYTFGSCTRLSPEAPVPVFVKKNSTIQQGLGCNVDILTHAELITKERFIDITSNQQLLRIDNDCKVTAITYNLFDNLKNNKLQSYDAIVISDYNKGYVEPNIIKKFINRANKTLTPIFVDSKKHDLSCFEGCIIKLNKKESKSITGWPTVFDLVVTHGKNGAVWKNKKFAAPNVEIHNVCGAGDTFLAGLVFNFLKTKNMESAIKFANQCGSIAVSKLGTYALNKEDINDICI